ncbi:MAG TPA: cyclic nucleotide-binding domain-containing protein, partial [Polyangiaceae bacterium]|nr:cyclic nucleotide-binding domain-containing protein [Polyangiaceae bacterium]
ADPRRCAEDVAASEAAATTTPEYADLWAEASLHEALGARDERERGAGAPAQARIDAALKRMRKAARDADGPKKAAALRAIGLFGDKRAEREVMMATASRDPAVYREAAAAAVALDLPGVVAGLVARLVAGPHAAIAGRALALVGPRAVRELVQALPVTRGEGAVAPTAVAEARIFSGTVRAARALARLGPAATREVLPLFGSLGHRARVALARAFSSPRLVLGERSRPLLVGALETLCASGEAVGVQIVAHRAKAPSRGLLVAELERRLDDTREAIIDLVTQLGDRTTVLRAQTAIAAGGRARDDALELVETLLPASIGRRVTRIFLGDFPAEEPPHALDGWLEKCRSFDVGQLPFGDPMASVIDKVLLLRDVTLFAGLSGEELFPVAEIAAMEEIATGTEIVRQGDPSDDLFVLAEGSLRVVKDGVEVSRIGRGQAFGELGVLDGEPRAASVFADGPTRLLRIPRIELESLLDESPELARGIIRTLLGYVRRAGRPSLAVPEPIRSPTRDEE